jgi:hypothetical protein
MVQTRLQGAVQTQDAVVNQRAKQSERHESCEVVPLRQAAHLQRTQGRPVDLIFVSMSRGR